MADTGLGLGAALFLSAGMNSSSLKSSSSSSDSDSSLFQPFLAFFFFLASAFLPALVALRLAAFCWRRSSSAAAAFSASKTSMASSKASRSRSQSCLSVVACSAVTSAVFTSRSAHSSSTFSCVRFQSGIESR